MCEYVARLAAEELGQDLIEYALLAGFIVLVCVAAITALGTKLNTFYFGGIKTATAVAAQCDMKTIARKFFTDESGAGRDRVRPAVGLHWRLRRAGMDRTSRHKIAARIRRLGHRRAEHFRLHPGSWRRRLLSPDMNTFPGRHDRRRGLSRRYGTWRPGEFRTSDVRRAPSLALPPTVTSAGGAGAGLRWRAGWSAWPVSFRFSCSAAWAPATSSCSRRSAPGSDPAATVWVALYSSIAGGVMGLVVSPVVGLPDPGDREYLLDFQILADGGPQAGARSDARDAPGAAARIRGAGACRIDGDVMATMSITTATLEIASAARS